MASLTLNSYSLPHQPCHNSSNIRGKRHRSSSWPYPPARRRRSSSWKMWSGSTPVRDSEGLRAVPMARTWQMETNTLHPIKCEPSPLSGPTKSYYFASAGGRCTLKKWTVRDAAVSAAALRGSTSILIVCSCLFVISKQFHSKYTYQYT